MSNKRKSATNISNLEEITKNKFYKNSNHNSTTKPSRTFETDANISEKGIQAAEVVFPDTCGKWVPKISAFTDREFKADGNYQKYMHADTSERINILTEGAEAYKPREEHHQRLSREHLKFLNKTAEEMKGYWEMKYTNQEDHARCFALLAQHTYLSRFEDDTKGVRSLINEKKKTVKPQKGLERFLNFYVPSKSRILITRNITFNMDDAIPVFTDIAGETLENLTIPKTLTFNYTDVNIINQVTERELARAVSMSQEKQNTIRCECSSSDPFVPCYENKQCSCYKMNVQMRCLQVEKEGYEPTEFATFKPSYFSHVRNKFYNYIGFACSDSCSCAGKCTNNSMMFIDNKTFPLEVIRTDKDYGFNVVSPVLIPAGTPVIEFVGEVVSEVNLNAENVDYSYKVSYSDDEKWRLLIADAPLSDDYKQVIYDLSYHNFYIDPKKHGNIGRMIGHACIPNLEVVRIFRKSLSPAHVSLVFVALEDIFPGTILSFDYGPAFAKTLKSYCQCGTFACRNNQKSDEYSKLSCADIALAIKDIHEIKHEMFEDRVMRPIRK